MKTHIFKNGKCIILDFKPEKKIQNYAGNTDHPTSIYMCILVNKFSSAQKFGSV